MEKVIFWSRMGIILEKLENCDKLTTYKTIKGKNKEPRTSWGKETSKWQNAATWKMSNQGKQRKLWS